MELLYFATFIVAFLSSILSGLAGSGGGFIMAPYWLLIGLSPTQAASAGSFMAIGMGGSSLATLKVNGHMPTNKKITFTLIAITIATSAIGPLFLQQFSSDTFKIVLAILTLVSLPFLFIDRRKLRISKKSKVIGTILLGILLVANSFIASAAFSIFISLTLAQTFGLSILQSTALRRLIALVQSIIVFCTLAILGNLLLFHGLVAFIGGSLGSYIGTKFAIKKGETFAKYALAAGAAISSFALLF